MEAMYSKILKRKYLVSHWTLQADLAKAAEGNKAAAARARKSTLELEKLGKDFAQVWRGCGADALHPHGLTLRYSGRLSRP